VDQPSSVSIPQAPIDSNHGNGHVSAGKVIFHPHGDDGSLGSQAMISVPGAEEVGINPQAPTGEQTHVVEVLAHPNILRAHSPITTWDLAAFHFDSNPGTRKRRFSRLRKHELARALRGLETWEQAQELNFWFHDLDVLVVYLHDVEDVPLEPAGAFQHAPIVGEVLKHGFETLTPARQRTKIYGDRYRRVCQRISTLITLLEASVAQDTSLPLPGYIALRIPGHVGNEITLLNRPDPDRRTNDELVNDSQACLIARIELFQDEKFMSRNNANWYLRFRLLDPGLLPWKPGQKITDVNPGVSHATHPLQSCYPPFWVKGFTPDSGHRPGLQKILQSGWCEVHQRNETVQLPSVLLAQTASGFYTYPQIAALVHDLAQAHDISGLEGTSMSHDHICTVIDPPLTLGSHRCGFLRTGKFLCEGMFCVSWENQKDNSDRRMDHVTARESTEEHDCTCVPGKSLPCVLSRVHETPAETRARFFTLWSDNLRALERCPYPDCDQKVATLTDLRDCLLPTKMNKLIAHLNAAHGHDLPLITTGGR
jgi:hypothetical protein